MIKLFYEMRYANVTISQMCETDWHRQMQAIGVTFCSWVKNMIVKRGINVSTSMTVAEEPEERTQIRRMLRLDVWEALSEEITTQYPAAQSTKAPYNKCPADNILQQGFFVLFQDYKEVFYQ